MLIFMCENNNNPLLSRLPKHKNKEKREEVLQKAKLFVQKLFASIYWRPRFNIQRLSFEPDT